MPGGRGEGGGRRGEGEGGGGRGREEGGGGGRRGEGEMRGWKGGDGRGRVVRKGCVGGGVWIGVCMGCKGKMWGVWESLFGTQH